MDERSFWVSLVGSFLVAAVFLWVVAVFARQAQPVPGFASDLLIEGQGWAKAKAYFLHNIQVLAAFGLLLVVCVFARRRPESLQWHTMLLVLVSVLVALVIFGTRLTQPFASLAAEAGVDPVALLGDMPHGLPEFAAIVFPCLYALCSLLFTKQLPGVKAAVLALAAAAILLASAAGVEAYVTPMLLG